MATVLSNSFVPIYQQNYSKSNKLVIKTSKGRELGLRQSVWEEQQPRQPPNHDPNNNQGINLNLMTISILLLKHKIQLSVRMQEQSFSEWNRLIVFMPLLLDSLMRIILCRLLMRQLLVERRSKSPSVLLLRLRRLILKLRMISVVNQLWKEDVMTWRK